MKEESGASCRMSFGLVLGLALSITPLGDIAVLFVRNMPVWRCFGYEEGDKRN
jgi:hypothetical protein